MEKNDFERLKDICEKEGFELSKSLISLKSENLLERQLFEITKKKDDWDGVEFAECIDVPKDCPELVFGRIYKVIYNEHGYIQFSGFKSSYGRNLFKPSTEQVYVEQLKKEAFERFGEINVGDKFDRSKINSLWGIEKIKDTKISYNKDLDRLFIGIDAIYEKGKWAEKVYERVKVLNSEASSEYLTVGTFPKFSFEFLINGKVGKNFNLTDASNFLSEQLEKYLNDEIE